MFLPTSIIKKNGLHLVPVDLKTAKSFIDKHHRYLGAPQGAKFGVGVADKSNALVGVAICGRPVSRHMDSDTSANFTLEVIRLALADTVGSAQGPKNACSMLYAACWSAARGMGYTRLITYTNRLQSKQMDITGYLEPKDRHASLKGSGILEVKLPFQKGRADKSRWEKVVSCKICNAVDLPHEFSTHWKNGPSSESHPSRAA